MHQLSRIRSYEKSIASTSKFRLLHNETILQKIPNHHQTVTSMIHPACLLNYLAHSAFLRSPYRNPNLCLQDSICVDIWLNVGATAEEILFHVIYLINNSQLRISSNAARVHFYEHQVGEAVDERSERLNQHKYVANRECDSHGLPNRSQRVACAMCIHKSTWGFFLVCQSARAIIGRNGRNTRLICFNRQDYRLAFMRVQHLADFAPCVCSVCASLELKRFVGKISIDSIEQICVHLRIKFIQPDRRRRLIQTSFLTDCKRVRTINCQCVFCRFMVMRALAWRGGNF